MLLISHIILLSLISNPNTRESPGDLSLSSLAEPDYRPAGGSSYPASLRLLKCFLSRVLTIPVVDSKESSYRENWDQHTPSQHVLHHRAVLPVAHGGTVLCALHSNIRTEWHNQEGGDQTTAQASGASHSPAQSKKRRAEKKTRLRMLPLLSIFIRSQIYKLKHIIINCQHKLYCI